MDRVRKVRIQFEDGKKVYTYLGENNRIGDCYWIVTSYHMKNYSCLVDKNGNPLTPLFNKQLLSCFSSKDRKNIFIELKNIEEENSYFYHFQKKNETYSFVFSTENKNSIPFRIEVTTNDDYWLLVSPEERKALYSVKDIKQLTPFFTKLELVEDASHHLAYFSHDIILEEEDSERFVATELVGFIGYQGEFSSRIFDMNDCIYKRIEDRYFTIVESGSLGRKSFEILCKNITIMYQNYYKLLNWQNDEIISELFIEKVVQNDIPSYQNPAKILEFPKR